MTLSKKEYIASYRPMPDKNRFWLHAEYCYTEEDLNFREWILKTRINSGIDAEYLTNPSSWFAKQDQALINVYEHSWLYSNAFKARHILSMDDFHVQPVASERLQWPLLYDLMQNVGDYLLIRNKKLVKEHLNQPMNYFLLDLNFILNRLSQNPNMAQVKLQLELINQYVRTVEKNISPTIGSDRLFLANFRKVIDDKIDPQLSHMIESQLLKDRLAELSKNIYKLSNDRNRILHFALNINPVNPHPYEFSTNHLEKEAIFYPTYIAKKCGTNQIEISKELNDILKLTETQLNKCPHFKLISMDKEILTHYAAAISDLNELDRFQTVITQIMDLLSQAGEVYTIHQFKEQMILALKQISEFVDDSSQHIDAIVQANTAAYHAAIQIEQDLSFWKKWLTSEKQILKIFIKNQDTLAQFPSSSSDLIKTDKEIKEHVVQVINHLNQPKIHSPTFATIYGQAQELNKLMSSMHGWIKNQYEIKGLIAPLAPKPVQIAAAEKPPNLITSTLEDNYQSTNCYSFFASNTTTCPINKNECQFKDPALQSTHNPDYYLDLGLITIIPLGILFLYLLMKWQNKKEETIDVSETQEKFSELIIKFEDLLTLFPEINEIEEYEYLILIYKDLKNNAHKGIYNPIELQELYEELTDAYQETHKKEQHLSVDNK